LQFYYVKHLLRTGAAVGTLGASAYFVGAVP